MALSNNKSQYGQDLFLDEKIFKGKINGTFIELGACDGIVHSNTFFFEKERNWSGMLIEPRFSEYLKLCKNRNCICEWTCIGDIEGSVDFLEVTGYAQELSGIVSEFHPDHKNRIDKESLVYKCKKIVKKMPIHKLDTILKKHMISEIDYCSLDTEGNELSVLKSIHFEDTNIKVFSIENERQESNIRDFMKQKKYDLIDRLGIDDFFIRVNDEK